MLFLMQISFRFTVNQSLPLFPLCHIKFSETVYKESYLFSCKHRLVPLSATFNLSLLTVFVSPLTIRLNWEGEIPIFFASSFCGICRPLQRSEIRCPGVPGKAINTHLLHMFPLYRLIAEMQFQKYRLWENAILATIRDLHFFLINWIYERSE